MPGEIYLCTVDDLASPDYDREEQLTFFSKILEKLGYYIISDDQHFHLWAVERGSLARIADWSGYLRPSEFEPRFLAWIHISTGILPNPEPGVPRSWTLQFGEMPVTFAIASAENEDWIIVIEESDPYPFTEFVGRRFNLDTRDLPIQLAGGRLRTSFRARDLEHEFDDQTSHT